MSDYYAAFDARCQLYCLAVGGITMAGCVDDEDVTECASVDEREDCLDLLPRTGDPRPDQSRCDA